MSEFLEEKIRSFLWDDHLGKYVNKQGVEISIQEDNSVNAACTIWKEKNESIEYGFNCQTLYRFISTLGIKELGEMDSIKPETLEKLYEEGKASLFCYVERMWLQFEKTEEGVMVTDYKGKMHLLASVPDKPYGYMDYTRTFLQ